MQFSAAISRQAGGRVHVSVPLLREGRAIGAIGLTRFKADPGTRAIPIIALTAHAMAGDREQALVSSCDDFDIKPIDLDGLLGKIEVLLGNKARA